MDIGDLGFLIIAFIVFIVNFIVKSNKEKIEAHAQKNKSEKPDLPELEPWEEEYSMPPFFDLPDLPDNRIGGEERGLKSFVPISDSIKDTEKRIQPAQKGMSSLSESLFKEDNMDSVSYQDEDLKGQASYTKELFHGNVTEELKKGIIYSEILHRKYE